MSAFFNNRTARRDKIPNDHAVDASSARSVRPGPPENERIYSELIAQRPKLLDEKLKLHELIIDEFNLSMLEKLPREELLKIVLGYVSDYARAEQLSLNQKELMLFAEEILDEMTGFGPIEPLL